MRLVVVQAASLYPLTKAQAGSLCYFAVSNKE